MSKFWLAGGYYIDLDEYEQLRIAGPGNHLFCGLTLPKPFYISHVHARKDVLRLRVSFEQRQVVLHQPVMGDIRSVRSVTELSDKARPTFASMLELYPGKYTPTEIAAVEKPKSGLRFTRTYGDATYGFRMILPKNVRIKEVAQSYELTSSQVLYFTIECFYTFPILKLSLTRATSNTLLQTYLSQLPHELQTLVRRSDDEIQHLVTYAKTSSYEYGTIFPRDWAESAELGKGDLSQKTIDEMYGQALQFVSGDGEGWHENVIGELAYEYEVHGRAIVDRGMVDIEPRYLLGLGSVSQRFLSKHEHLQALQRVARYVMHQSEIHEEITFKQRPVGNWRDSLGAYKHMDGPIIPFDVNAVFYPAALGQIYRFHHVLHISEDEIVPLMAKWHMKREQYLFTNRQGLPAYALCLYGATKQRLEVDHTDEAYLLIYGSPTEEDCASLAKRLLDPTMFYTNSGPLLVGKQEGYSPQLYHGEVIWPKQSALLVMGLRRQIERARHEKWSDEMQLLLRDALFACVRTSMRAFVELKSVPELYIDQSGHALAYDSQQVREGQVSYSQLWSAVGFRRMLRDLIYVSMLYDVPLNYFSE